jgi:hypothetical protein
MKKIKNKTIPITNKIQAISDAIPATPVRPNRPAIKAMIKKITAQLNIIISPDLFERY